MVIEIDLVEEIDLVTEMVGLTETVRDREIDLVGVIDFEMV